VAAGARLSRGASRSRHVVGWLHVAKGHPIPVAGVLRGMDARIALLALALATAGCVGRSGHAPPTPAPENKTGTFQPGQEKLPTGGTCSACVETNHTEVSGTGAIMHAHDYWGGATRKVIWSEDAWLVPLPLQPDGKPAGTAIADFDIPAGPPGDPRMVFEGTDHLEIALSNVTVLPDATCLAKCSSPPGLVPHPSPTLDFDYLTAGDEPGKFRQGGQLVAGTPFNLAVKPTDADMPHSEKSLWVFRLYTEQPTSISFHVQATAVRGAAIATWPPHPNVYADKTDRTVFDGPVSLSNEGTAQENVDGKDPGWTHPAHVISWGTDGVDVAVTDVSFNPQVPVTPDHYVLEYHNATYIPKLGNGDQAGGRVEDKGTDGKTWHFHVPVDNQSYDSPYGQSSRWGFRLMPRFAGTADPTNCFASVEGSDPDLYHDLQNTMIGCQYVPWTLTYHLTVVAHGHSTANGA
jgi:hypothetical protein